MSDEGIADTLRRATEALKRADETDKLWQKEAQKLGAERDEARQELALMKVEVSRWQTAAQAHVIENARLFTEAEVRELLELVDWDGYRRDELEAALAAKRAAR